MASDTIAISTSTSVDINDAQAHLDRIVDACHRLKSLVNQAYMTEMSDADTDQTSDSNHSISLGLGMIAKLKQLNRTAYFNGRDAKTHATTFRDNLEKQHLDLQNLLYEQTHLREEIRKCREREYLYTDVDMYTLDEFMEKAPEELRAPNIDAHTLMLNRLQFELQERERLRERENELLRQRQEFLYENKKRGEELRQVDEQFEAFVKMVHPIVTSLGLQESKDKTRSMEDDSEMNEHHVDTHDKADNEIDDEIRGEQVDTPAYSRNANV